MQDKSRKRKTGYSSECGEGMYGSTSREEPRSKKIKETSGVRSRAWVFTTATRENFYTLTENAKIWVGPREADGTVHGVIYSNWRRTEEACPYWRKQSVCNILQRQGIALYNSYISPVKNREAYINYMYKTEEVPEIPKELLEWAKKGGDKIVNSNIRIIKGLYRKFSKRPKRAAWSKIMIDAFGFGVSETLITRSYRNWPAGTNKLLQRQLSCWEKNNVLEMTGKQGYKLIQEILNNVTNAKHNKEKLTRKEIETLLLSTAIEARTKSVQYAPHWLMEGTAGSGKTLLNTILFPPEIAGALPNDSKGVGQMQLDAGQLILKIDDASENFWSSSEILAAVYTMYHNKWEAKIHGTKESNEATCAVITSNNLNNLERIGEIADYGGAERRFVVLQFGKKITINQQYDITSNSSLETLQEWIRQWQPSHSKKVTTLERKIAEIKGIHEEPEEESEEEETTR